MRTGFIIRSKVGLAAWSIAILTILLAPLSNIASALPEGPQTMHVTGTVITQAGSPLDDASVTVDISHDSTNYNPFTSTTTDSNGTYAVDIIVGPSNQINDYNFTYTAPSGSGITEPITYRDLSFNNTVSDSMTLDAQFGNSLHIGGGYIWRDHRILYLEVVGIRNVTGAIPDSWGERWDGNDPTHDNGVQFGVGGQYALVPLPNMSGAGTHTIHVQAYDTMGSSNIISVPIDIGIDITLNSQPGTREDPSFSWAPVAGAAYYKVDDGGLATLPANQTSFTDIGAAAGGGGVTYYMVDAYDANDLLLNSGYLTLHIGPAVPPTSQRAAASPTSSPPVLKWFVPINVGADYFEILRDGVSVGTTTGHSFTDTTAPEGTHSYQIAAVNTAGSLFLRAPFNVTYDPTPPVITYSLSPEPNTAGWNNTDTTVSFSCTDQTSGVQSCSDPVTVTSQGSAIPVTGTGTDNLGNSGSVTATLKIDKTAPTVSGATMNPTLFLNNGTATVSANAADSLSGIAGGEYYIDTDPGQGNGHALAFANGKISGTATISNLKIGRHKLYMRSQDAAGNWSTTTVVSFTYV